MVSTLFAVTCTHCAVFLFYLVLVTYQIKENHECSNIVAILCPQIPLSDPRDGVNRPNFNFFLEYGHSCVH